MLFVARLTILISFSSPVWAADHLQATSIDNRLFDANHCLERITVSPFGDRIDFHWGCGEEKYITMECAIDRHNQRRAPPKSSDGWHCNRPLPVLKLDGVNRIADVAVGSVGEKAAWAGCFIDGYGDFDGEIIDCENPGSCVNPDIIVSAGQGQPGSPGFAIIVV